MEAKSFVEGLFSKWQAGDSGPFFAALSDNLVWTAIGGTPISGTYHSKQEYVEKVYRPLLAIFQGPTQCTVNHMMSEGQIVIVEWHGETPITSGRSYSQDYCWVIRLDSLNETILEVRGYFDTEAVSKLLATEGNAGRNIAHGFDAYKPI